MTAPAPPSTNVINNHVAKRAPSRHDGAGHRGEGHLLLGTSTPQHRAAAARGYCQLDAKETTLPRDLSRLAYERGTSSIPPSGKGAITSSAVPIGGEAMAAELEVVVDRSVSGEELLRLPG
jgi:hypothetical protein